ncbi:MAG: membrane dipeptidase [Gammaproteobacteria bacterium]|nr:membrane dipeptidase [Gammaproteobacteria bacterium]MYD03130.1 membrane dipeptidase [Gammaproteobacteria bacterium]MYI25753.1 membrane dipeptidase [Gammaproteobacteria bacterium]
MKQAGMGAVAILMTGFLADAAGADTEVELLDRARVIHERVIAIDTHVDIPPDFGTEAYDPAQAKPPGQQVDLPGMEQGGLDAAFFIVFVMQRERSEAGYARAIADAFVKYAAIRKMTDVDYSDRIGLALTAADVRRIHAEGRRVALIGIENGFSIGRHVDLLDVHYAQGARYLGLVHNGHNDIGDSAVPNLGLGDTGTEHGGLSGFGRAVIRRANELGIMVDISHASEATAMDAIEASAAPVIASHSAVKGAYSHARNLSDEGLLALRDSGGVAQIVAFDAYLRPTPPEKAAAMGALYRDMSLRNAGDFARMSPEQRESYYSRLSEITRMPPRASVKHLADHIDYAVGLIGIDHVGISSDFNGGGGIEGWDNAGETLNVTVELVRRGYSEEQIAKLWGGNLLRVMEAVESVAAD